MSNKDDNNIPEKNSIIINPKTNRAIKVGHRAWLQLVREGLIDGDYYDSNELYEMKEGDDIKQKIQELNKDLPINQQSVKGRGKYKNKIVKRHRAPSTLQISRHTARKTAQKLKNRKVYDDLQEKGDFENELETMIMNELTSINNQQPRKQTRIKQQESDSEPDSEPEEITLETESESESESEYSE